MVKLREKQIAVFFLMLPHFEVACVEALFPRLNMVVNMLRLVSVGCIGILYLGKRKMPSRLGWIIIILNGWLILTTLIKGGNIRYAFLNAGSVVALTLFAELFSDSITDMLFGLRANIEWMLYANLLTVIKFYPEGLYESDAYYFLGNRNGFIIYALLASELCVLLWKKETRHLRGLLMIGAGVAAILITGSRTSLLVLLMVGIILLCVLCGFGKWISYPLIFLATSIADILVTIYRIAERVPFFSRFVADRLQKETNLTSRTVIWDVFFQKFKKSPWFGYGFGVRIFSGTKYTATYSSTHNQWFMMLFVGGIFALILFLLLNFEVGSAIQKGISAKDKNSRLLLSIFAGMYIFFISEAVVDMRTYLIFLLAYFYEKKLQPSWESTTKSYC